MSIATILMYLFSHELRRTHRNSATLGTKKSALIECVLKYLNNSSSMAAPMQLSRHCDVQLENPAMFLYAIFPRQELPARMHKSGGTISPGPTALVNTDRPSCVYNTVALLDPQRPLMSWGNHGCGGRSACSLSYCALFLFTPLLHRRRFRRWIITFSVSPRSWVVILNFTNLANKSIFLFFLLEGEFSVGRQQHLRQNW